MINPPKKSSTCIYGGVAINLRDGSVPFVTSQSCIFRVFFGADLVFPHCAQSLWPLRSHGVILGGVMATSAAGVFVWSCQWEQPAGCCFDRRGVYSSGSRGHSEDKLRTSKANATVRPRPTGAKTFSHWPRSKANRNVVGFSFSFLSFPWFPWWL